MYITILKEHSLGEKCSNSLLIILYYGPTYIDLEWRGWMVLEEIESAVLVDLRTRSDRATLAWRVLQGSKSNPPQCENHVFKLRC